MEEESNLKRARKVAEGAFLQLLKDNTPPDAASTSPREFPCCQPACLPGHGITMVATTRHAVKAVDGKCIARQLLLRCVRDLCYLFAGPASPVSGSARVSVPKVSIDQDSIFVEAEVALQDEPAWQVGTFVYTEMQGRPVGSRLLLLCCCFLHAVRIVANRVLMWCPCLHVVCGA